MFRARYLLGIWNRLEDNVRFTIGSKLPTATNPDVRDSDYQDPNDDDMARLQEYDVYYEERAPREEEYPDRPMPTRERDHSSWMNRYEQERETRPPDEYPFQDFNYGP